ncbi:MAG: molybdopterin-dependent oxidoreductase [Candidatus Dormiibacterota bacterium]
MYAPAHDPALVLSRGGRFLPGEALRYDQTPAGLHWLVPGFELPDLDRQRWRLVVGGHTQYALGISLAGIQRRPRRTLAVTLASSLGLAGAASQAEWTGTPLRAVLQESAPLGGARQVVFSAADRFVPGRSDGSGGGGRRELRLPLADALAGDLLLAWAMNGEPLPIEHDSPLRLLAPGRYGEASLRWLTAITITDQPGEPDPDVWVRMEPNAAIEPPGLPEATGGCRVLAAGSTVLRGRAWSGRGVVTRVEVSTDGGARWREATVIPGEGAFAWAGWSAAWDAEPGSHALTCRATDASGRVQAEPSPPLAVYVRP